MRFVARDPRRVRPLTTLALLDPSDFVNLTLESTEPFWNRMALHPVVSRDSPARRVKTDEITQHRSDPIGLPRANITSGSIAHALIPSDAAYGLPSPSSG